MFYQNKTKKIERCMIIDFFLSSGRVLHLFYSKISQIIDFDMCVWHFSLLTILFFSCCFVTFMHGKTAHARFSPDCMKFNGNIVTAPFYLGDGEILICAYVYTHIHMYL